MLKALDEDKNDVIGNLFEIELDVETKCAENEHEPATKSKERVLKLSCFIDNNNNPIDNMTEGINISFNGELDKNSPSLGREARYTQTKKINALPSYLCVNFVRFYWKGQSAAAGTDAGKAKILRSVTFPKTMDVYNMCSDELKKSLDAGREFETKLLEEEDAKRGGTIKKGEENDPKQDVEMKEESKEDIKVYTDHTGKRLVGEAAKAAEKADQ
jgi:ubiquitin carboxyl-terminal hydrolase 14